MCTLLAMTAPKKTSSASSSTSGANNANNDGLGNNVVKQGFLWIKRPPRSYWNKLKAWHKRYFLLRDSFVDNTSILQMYNCQQDVKAGQIPLLSLELNETVHIGIASESHRFANVLVLVCHGRAPLLLAADDELAARSWLLALDLTAQSRNCELSVGGKFSWSGVGADALCGNGKCSSGADHHHHHHNSGSDSSTNGSACSCAPAFVRESSGFSDPTHGVRSNVSSGERIPDDCFWTADWHENNSFDAGLVMERFQVCVQPTDASERACLRGQLQLVIFTRGVGVARVGDFECFLLWPIAFIRQYRHESLKNKNSAVINGATYRCGKNGNKRQTLVTLEVGRRCSTGEGIFAFRTVHGQDIMRQLKRAISNWAQYRSNCRSMGVTAAAGGKSFMTWSSHGHRPRNSRSRSSAPCTPNVCKALDFAAAATSSQSTPSPRHRIAVNGGHHKRDECYAPLPSCSTAASTVATKHVLIGEKSGATLVTDDVNYVIPVFLDTGDDDYGRVSTSDAECSYYRKASETRRLRSDAPPVSAATVVSEDKCATKCQQDTRGPRAAREQLDNAYMEVIAT